MSLCLFGVKGIDQLQDTGRKERTSSGTRYARAAATDDRRIRQLGRAAAGPNRYVYVAGAVALTEPGPAAAGIVVADEQGRMLAQRWYYLGDATLAEATAHALLAAMPLAIPGGLEAPVFRIDVPELADALAAASHRRG